MRKILGLLLLPVFLGPGVVVSTEKNVELTEEQRYVAFSSPYGNYYTDLPKHPVVTSNISTFKDIELKDLAGNLISNTILSIKQLHVNESGVPVFQLTNGQFIVADKRTVMDDVILEQENVSTTKWLKRNFTVYEQPYFAGVKKKATSLKPYTKVTVSQSVTTNRGQYALVDDQGWVDIKELSDQDNRIEQVQELLNSKYNKADYGIYVKQLDTNQEAGINSDQVFYSASVSKLPYLYYAEKLIDEGKLDPNKPLKYIPEVNDYSGSYAPEGSGSLPKSADNKDYTVADLMNRVAKESDNVAHNILGYYITNKSDKTFQKEINHLAEKKWDVENREVSVRMVGHILEAIYDQNSGLVDIMSQTNFDDQRISKNISVKVAHKIGDAYDYKHDAAIIYGRTPFILVVFTNNSNYDTITQIADDVYGVLK